MALRIPRPSLRPFVEALWSHDEALLRDHVTRREHVLPTGRMHLVVRLADDPLRLFQADDDLAGHLVSTAVLGGPRASYYVREVSRPLCSVGATLLPGAAFALFGVRADELATRHTPLEDLWGASAVGLLRERLAGARSHADRFDVFEAALAARLPRVHGLHPAVAQALDDLRASRPVQEAVRRSGYSHRALVDLFSGAVGLTPKRYARVRRFRGALRRAAAAHERWTDIAAALGYSDQAHFVREFREFAGLTPSRYRLIAPRFAHHVPVESDSFKTGQTAARYRAVVSK
jgi:AraC-like DNA-binding protein